MTVEEPRPGMSYEIWSAHRYGSQFGLPETRLADGLSVEQVPERLRLGFTGHLLHNLLVVHEGVSWRGNKWLDQFGGKA